MVHRTLVPQFRRLTVLAASVALALASPAWADDAQILSITGTGEKRGATATQWQPAAPQEKLVAGAFVRTAAMSQMALLLRDQTQLRINQNTVLQIKEAASQSSTTRLELSAGRVWAQAKRDAPAPVRTTGAPGSAAAAAPAGPPAVTVQTPHALAAVRGTDWELSVEDGVTTLVVLSGQVDLSNGAGSLSVPAGQAARVRAGEAPVRITLVRPRDRVQWVNAWRPDPHRWVRLPAAALLPAVQAIDTGRLADGLAALQQAAPRLNAQAQADAHILQADLLLYQGEAQAALDTLQGQSGPVAQALAGRALLLQDRTDEARQITERARATYPDHPEPWLLAAELARLDGDGLRATALLRGLTQALPQWAPGWHELGRVLAERDDLPAARVALRQALALDDASPNTRAELAQAELQANRLDEAQALLAEALRREPDDYVALTAQGLLALKRGEGEAALQAFLKAGVLEPRHARTAVQTGIALYQQGRDERARETLERAAELDPRDPLPLLLRSMMDGDREDWGSAIASARAAAERLPYLKSLNSVLSDQKGNANLGYALLQMGLPEWAEKLAYDSYTPYWAGAPLFLGSLAVTPFNANSELFKGLLVDPLVFGASRRRNQLTPVPGHHGSATVGTVRDYALSTFGTVTLNGLTLSPLPLSYEITVDQANNSSRDVALRSSSPSRLLALGLKPTEEMAVFFYGFDGRSRLKQPVGDPTQTGQLGPYKSYTQSVDVGMSWRFGPSHMLWFKAGGRSLRERSQALFVSDQVATIDTTGLLGQLGPQAEFTRLDTVTRQRELQLRHTLDVLPEWQFTWGIERALRQQTFGTDIGLDSAFLGINNLWVIGGQEVTTHRMTSAYVANRVQLAPGWRLAFDLERSSLDRTQTADSSLSANFTGLGAVPLGGVRQTNLQARQQQWNPRLALAWQPHEAHTLRLAAQRWVRPPSGATLAPIDTLGIAYEDRLGDVAGEQTRLRLQHEWLAARNRYVRSFVDHRRIDNRLAMGDRLLNIGDIEVDGLSRLGQPPSLESTALDLWEDSPNLRQARITTVGVAVNELINPRWALTAVLHLNNGRSTYAPTQGLKVPGLPQRTAYFEVNHLPAPGWQVSMAAWYLSQRYLDDANRFSLQGGWRASAFVRWIAPDRRWSVELVGNRLGSKSAVTGFNRAQLAALLTYRH